MAKQVAAERLRRILDPNSLAFDSTEAVAPLEGLVGQPRATDAIEFGLRAQLPGFNLFVAGLPGSGRLTTVMDYLNRFAKSLPAPDDWAYIHNFDEPDRPKAIRLPQGEGRALAARMEEFIVAAKQRLRAGFEGEPHEQQHRQLMADVQRKRDAAFSDLERFGNERHYAVQMTPSGIVAVPLVDGKPMTPEVAEHLTEEQRSDIETKGAEVQEATLALLTRLRMLEREANDKVKELDRQIALFAVDPLLKELQERYAKLPAVLAYLEMVRSDIADRFRDLVAPQEDDGMTGLLRGGGPKSATDRYRINVFVDNDARPGAPVILERNPTYYNLMGRIEYHSFFGGATTDFRQIKAGAMHRANGGFLVLEAEQVLSNPFAWDALKRALSASAVRIENLGEHLSTVPMTSLQAEPIPIAEKVILIGSNRIYQLLSTFDDDFAVLFKVKADFAPEMDWTDEHVAAYAAFVSACVRKDGLLHFDRTGVARVVEEGARMRDDQRRLSTRLLEVSDLVAEASLWAGRNGHGLVGAADVEEAVNRRVYRSDRPREQYQRMIADGTIRVETDGTAVGQVNGLSVIELGDNRFGLPARLTAQVALGRGSVDSIEREIKLSGPIHSKGVLILTGFLAGKYAQERPLAMRATLTFEQSYDEIEGDSASSAELYALLSALSGLPLNQGIAVTGSVDQHGHVQAIGGATTKIEGFFDVCRQRGLTGNQGVVIPLTNLDNLMLRPDVVEAARQGSFHVWTVATIDEGIELLTGRPAGEVHRLVEARLQGYADIAKAQSVSPNGAKDGEASLERAASSKAAQ